MGWFGSLTNWMAWFSSWSTPVIVGLFCAHLVAFFILILWARRDLRTIASTLFDFTRGLRHQSILDSHAHLSDQIDAFLADVGEVLDDHSRTEDRRSLLDRIRILDEKRRYLSTMSFETRYNVVRTMVEAYPFFGILGTLLAIGTALNTPNSDPTATVSMVVQRFGESVWSSVAGIFAAIVLMYINSLLEPGFARLSENRRHVRDMIARTKRELSLFSPVTRTTSV